MQRRTVRDPETEEYFTRPKAFRMPKIHSGAPAVNVYGTPRKQRSPTKAKKIDRKIELRLQQLNSIAKKAVRFRDLCLGQAREYGAGDLKYGDLPMSKLRRYHDLHWCNNDQQGSRFFVTVVHRTWHLDDEDHFGLGMIEYCGRRRKDTVRDRIPVILCLSKLVLPSIGVSYAILYLIAGSAKGEQEHFQSLPVGEEQTPGIVEE